MAKVENYCIKSEKLVVEKWEHVVPKVKTFVLK